MAILNVNGLCMISYDYIEAGELYGRLGTRLFTFVIWESGGKGCQLPLSICIVRFVTLCISYAFQIN